MKRYVDTRTGEGFSREELQNRLGMSIPESFPSLDGFDVVDSGPDGPKNPPLAVSVGGMMFSVNDEDLVNMVMAVVISGSDGASVDWPLLDGSKATVDVATLKEVMREAAKVRGVEL